VSTFNEYCKSLQKNKKTAFVAYFTAGYPSMEKSLSCIKAAMDNGADIIEVGIPFSDPVADGPTIAKASTDAIEAGFEVDDLLLELKKLRDANYKTPIVLFSYLNPIFKKGPVKIAKKLNEIGVEAVLIVDCPFEEADIYYPAFKNEDVSPVLLVSPTTTEKRISLIAEKSEGFIYSVSQVGVTGTRSSLNLNAESELKRIRSLTDKPIYAGFGISSPEQAKTMAQYCDGIIIGSALTKIISQDFENAEKNIAEFVTSIKKSIS